MEYLNINPQRIHMPQPQLDVVQFASRLGRDHIPPRALRERSELPGGVLRRCDQERPELLLSRFQIVSGPLRFDDMGVSVDDLKRRVCWHTLSPAMREHSAPILAN